MDLIRDAFSKVRKEIENLQEEIDFLKNGLRGNRERMIELCEIMKKIELKISTHQQKIKTPSKHLSTDNVSLEPLKPKNIPFSTGNQGVSTDRQTDRQTDQQTQKDIKNKENSLENALEILNSLDDIKKEIRLKFKRLTEQEILIFSTIYQIEEENGYANYKLIAKKLNLTESSVRDYVGRLIKKEIPLEKKKINNKQIQLYIAQNLKKVVTLSTILKLRDI